VLLQFAVTWLSVRSEAVQNLVKAQPTILVHRGQWQEPALRRERVTREEVLAALRSQGRKAMDETTTVVIETDGSLAVLTGQTSGEGSSSLENVLGPRDHSASNAEPPRAAKDPGP
jgi:uncharacterized membrane protein YcaP (DUF421 family)